MTEREELLLTVEALLERQGKGVWVSPAATESDLRWLLRFHVRESEETAQTYWPSGVHTQLGGNRVQLTRDGIAVRPAYSPQRR